MPNDNFLEHIRKATEEKEEALQNRTLKPAYIAQTKDESGIDPRIITYHDPKSSIAENYRTIFSHLKTSLDKQEVKIIAVTSASNSEGKSIVALNLSLVMARDFGKKILVLDGNLRRPMVDELINLNAKEGLSGILSKGLKYKDVLITSKIDNLYFITAGSNDVNPVELLSSKKMPEFLKEIRESFDCVIIDTPAVMPYADSKIVSSLVDGVILTVRAHKTRREVINRTQILLEDLGVKILGFILTDTEYYIPDFIYRHL